MQNIVSRHTDVHQSYSEHHLQFLGANQGIHRGLYALKTMGSKRVGPSKPKIPDFICQDHKHAQRSQEPNV